MANKKGNKNLLVVANNFIELNDHIDFYDVIF